MTSRHQYTIGERLRVSEVIVSGPAEKYRELYDELR